VRTRSVGQRVDAEQYRRDTGVSHDIAP
jgi:hypothetical protein